MSRSLWIGALVVAAGAAVALGVLIGQRGDASDPPAPEPVAVMAARAGGDTITVYKSPTCGCCSAWIDHAKAAGFAVNAVDVQSAAELMNVKSAHGITPDLAACHTSIVAGYVVEGHVPADLIHRLLAERPAIRGLVVPGMPPRSPGMDVPTGGPYDVLALDSAGATRVYAKR